MKKIQIITCCMPLIISVSSALWLVLTEETMDASNWIAILVAIIGVIGSLIATFIQLRHDGKTISKIDSTASETKPQIKAIEERTKKVRDVIVEEIRPEVKQLSSANHKLDYITREIDYQKRIKADIGSAVNDSAYLIAGINKVYEENARLSRECAAQNERVRILTVEKSNLIKENRELKTELENYRRAYEEDPISHDL